MSAWFCATNFVHASASPIGPAMSFASMPSFLKYPILIGTQRSKSSITSRVPRGEIQRTVWVAVLAPRMPATCVPGQHREAEPSRSRPLEEVARE